MTPGRGLIQLLHADSFHGGASRQVHWLEGAVKHELNLDVVRALRVIGPFLRLSANGPQMAREKQLRPDHPTLFKGDFGVASLLYAWLLKR